MIYILYLKRSCRKNAKLALTLSTSCGLELRFAEMRNEDYLISSAQG